jgi:Fe(3+) dicitrate transport protein
METIEVTATVQERVTVDFKAGFKLDKAALDKFEYDDIHRILASVPGVYFREEDGFGLRPNIGMRGVSSDRSKKVVLMEDGVLLGPAPYSAPAAYYFPLSTRMDSIEIFKGPAIIPYGPNTLGGAINMFTAQIPQDRKIKVDLQLGQDTFGKLHALAGESGLQWGWLMEAVHIETEGFKKIDGGGDSGFSRNDIMLKGRWNSDPGGELYHQVDVKLSYGDETSHETYLGLSMDDFLDKPFRRYRASYDDTMNWKRTQVQVDYTVEVDESMQFKLTAYRHDFNRTWRKLNAFWGENNMLVPGDANYGTRNLQLSQVLARPDAYKGYMDVLRGDSDTGNIDAATPGNPWENSDLLMMGTNQRSFVSQGVQLAGHVQLLLGDVEQDIRFGMRYHFDTVTRDQVQEPLAMINHELHSVGMESRPYTNNTDKADALAFYFYDEIRWQRLTVNPGLRMEWIRTSRADRLADAFGKTNDVVVLPGLGINYEVIDHLNLKAGIHQGFSPVSPGQSAETRPGRSIQYEAGASYEHTWFRIESTGFFNDYSNLIGQSGMSGGATAANADLQFNSGSANILGVELLATLLTKLPWQLTVPVNLAYTFTDARFVEPTENNDPLYGGAEEGDYIPYLPMHQAMISIGLTHPRFDLTLAGKYQDAMRDAPGQGPLKNALITDEHFVLDIAGTYRLSESLAIYGKIDNATRTKYIVSHRPFGIRPGKPMRVFVGLKVKM